MIWFLKLNKILSDLIKILIMKEFISNSMISITHAVPFWHPFAEIIESLLPSPWPDWADAQNVKEASSCWAVNWAWIGPTCSRSIGYSKDSSPKTYQTLSCHGSIPNSLMACEQQRTVPKWHNPPSFLFSFSLPKATLLSRIW